MDKRSCHGGNRQVHREKAADRNQGEMICQQEHLGHEINGQRQPDQGQHPRKPRGCEISPEDHLIDGLRKTSQRNLPAKHGTFCIAHRSVKVKFIERVVRKRQIGKSKPMGQEPPSKYGKQNTDQPISLLNRNGGRKLFFD